jgi:hypothetical protein
MDLLRSANKFGLRVDLVNIMTMSMGISNGATGMGDANVQAAQNLRRQLISLGMTNTLVGLTPMVRITLMNLLKFGFKQSYAR